MQTYINPFKQNNDHTRIMRKIRFPSSFKAKYKANIFQKDISTMSHVSSTEFC